MAQYALYKGEKGEKSQRVVSPGMLSFALIWFGQIVSLLGSGMTCFAQSVWVYTDQGARITHLTALAVSAQLPGLLVSPLAGVLVDRWDRRWVMIISDAVAALATMTLRTLIITGHSQLWHIYLIVIVISVANHFQWPAYFATVSMMVPKRNLGTANGMIQMGRALGQIVAPFLAGLVVVSFKIQGVILFDMATYLFALATLLVVRIPKPPIAATSGVVKSSLWRSMIEGWKYLVARPGLLGLLVLFAASNFSLGIIGLLVVPLVLSITSAAVLGSLLSVGGISMLAGSLVMSFWGGPKRRIYGVLGFTLIQGAAIILAGLSPSLSFLFIAAIIAYLAAPIVNACGGVIWQSKVELTVQGRVLAASGLVSSGAMHLAYLIAGPLADYVFEPALAEGGLLAGSVGRIIGTGDGRGIAFMFVIFGALCILAVVGAYLHPRIRLLDKELPDAIEDSSVEQSSKWAIETSPFIGGAV